MIWEKMLEKLKLGGTGGGDSVNITAAEASLALDALENVGCVEVSPEVAEELGAFDEQALSLDDVVDGD